MIGRTPTDRNRVRPARSARIDPLAKIPAYIHVAFDGGQCAIVCLVHPFRMQMELNLVAGILDQPNHFLKARETKPRGEQGFNAEDALETMVTRCCSVKGDRHRR